MVKSFVKKLAARGKSKHRISSPLIDNSSFKVLYLYQHQIKSHKTHHNQTIATVLINTFSLEIDYIHFLD